MFSLGGLVGRRRSSPRHHSDGTLCIWKWLGFGGLLAVCCLHCIFKNLVNVVLSFRYFHGRCYKMFRVPTCAPSHLTKGFVDATLTLYCSFWQKRTEIWVLLGMLLGLQYSPVSIMEVFG